jgi:2-polyprenyl-3-methyl-5-hydroxy-6-metoxy-1,4-benzoquinol methylase
MNYENPYRKIQDGATGDLSLQFEKDYFFGRNYKRKEKLVKRNVAEVIKWASNVSGVDFSLGSGKKALDVGCAYGYASEVLATFGYETCSVDVSKWGIRQAKVRADGGLLICDAQTRLPFKTECFDLVTCFDVLEHLRSPEKAIQNMLQSCRGSLICTTPNRRVEKPVRQLMRDFDETHVSVKSPAEWEKCLKDIAGYRLIKVETFLDVTAKLNSSVLLKSFRVPALGLTVRVLIMK